MKKAKVMFLLAAVITMALAFVTAVYADDEAYADLSVSSKVFYSNHKIDLGVYPVVKDMDSLNREIENSIQKLYWSMPDYNRSFFNDRLFLSSYEVENSIKTNPDGINQFAKVTVSVRMYRSSGQSFNNEFAVETYYIDKDGMKKISKDDYDKGVKAEGEVIEEVVVDEIDGVMVLKANVISLGYEYDIDTESGVITITTPDGALELTLNKNEYPGEVTLASAPELENGVVVVPVSFFTNILGVEVIEIDGRYVVAVDEPESESESE